MTTIDRTAYPRPGERLTLEELQVRYELSDADRAFIESSAINPTGRLAMPVMLKTRQALGYFPALADVSEATIAHLAGQLGPSPLSMSMGDVSRTTLYRYRSVIRTHLAVMPFDDAGERLVTEVVLKAAGTMSDPADLINRAVEALHDAAIDLPAFSTLDRLVSHLRAKVHQEIYASVAARLTQDEAAALDALLIVPPDAVTTPFNRLKQVPGPARLKTIKLWTDRLDWLDNLTDAGAALSGIAPTKLRQFAAEAMALEVSELLDMVLPGKRYTLLLSLLHHARTRCRDELDWISFGGTVVKSADPVEQEKQIKYASLVANAIMLSNVADLTTVLTGMADDDHPVTPDLVAAISPYTREHIRRFGRYVLDMDDVPEPLNPDRMPFQNAA